MALAAFDEAGVDAAVVTQEFLDGNPLAFDYNLFYQRYSPTP